MAAHVTALGGGFSTEVLIHNADLDAQTYTFTPYNSSGQVGTPARGSMEGRSASRFSISELFENPESVSHFSVVTSAPEVLVTLSYQANGPGSAAHLSTSSGFPTKGFLLPGNWNIFFDGVAMVNMGTQDASIIVRQKNASGSIVQEITHEANLPSMAKSLMVIGGPNGGAFSNAEDTLFEIESTQPLAIIALRGTVPGSETNYLWENQTITATEQDEWIFMGHMTREGGGFASTIFVINDSAENQEFSLRPYDSAGNALPKVTRQLGAGSFGEFAPSTLLGSPDVSHFLITRRSRDLHFSVSYITATGPGGPAQVSATPQLDHTWQIYPGDWTKVFDGFAVVNLGLADTDIFVQQIQMAGTGKIAEVLVCQKALSDLAHDAKGLYVLGGPGVSSPFQASENTYFRVFSPLPVALVPLRGTVPGSDVGILWYNAPTRLPLPLLDNDPFCLGDTGDVFVIKPYDMQFSRRKNISSTKQGSCDDYPSVPDREAQVMLAQFFVDSGVFGKPLAVNKSNAESQVIVESVNDPQDECTDDSEVILSQVSWNLGPGLVCQEVTWEGSSSHSSSSYYGDRHDSRYDTSIVIRDSATGEELARFDNLDNRNRAGWAVAIFCQILEGARSSPQMQRLRLLALANPCGFVWSLNSWLITGFPRAAEEIDVVGAEFSPQDLDPHPFDGRQRKLGYLTGLDEVFPCGQSENGFTLCPENVQEPMDGDHIIAYAMFRDMVALDDPQLHYQFGFVFDGDGNPNNNWVADPQFPGDTFQGTDQWYVATYSPINGWFMEVIDARNNIRRNKPSAARITFKDNLMALVVPAEEFAVPFPGYRVTSYAHHGDWGQNQQWSGDLHPAVGEPLLVPVDLK